MACLFKNVYAYDGQMSHAYLCDVLVEKGYISRIEGAGRIAEEHFSLIDCDGKKALLPGFVNGHTHAAMTLLRGLGEETPLMTWLKEQIWQSESIGGQLLPFWRWPRVGLLVLPICILKWIK